MPEEGWTDWSES